MLRQVRRRRRAPSLAFADQDGLPVFDPIEARHACCCSTLQAAESLYAVDVDAVVEVVPRVEPAPAAPCAGFLAGVFDYRGVVVPVIDLGFSSARRRAGAS